MALSAARMLQAVLDKFPVSMPPLESRNLAAASAESVRPSVVASLFVTSRVAGEAVAELSGVAEPTQAWCRAELAKSQNTCRQKAIGTLILRISLRVL